MPAKYSHVKKRSVYGPTQKTANGHSKDPLNHQTRKSHPHIDRSISKAMSAISQLERTIARILLLRYEQDIARLFSAHLYNVTLTHLPTFAMRCISLAGPGWVVYNYDCEEIKDFYRAAIAMDMRQAGERVATKSILWSYTALRHFALSNNVPICAKRGLHSLRLLEHYPALKSHVEALEAAPVPSFEKLPHLGSFQEGQEALEDACELKYRLLGDQSADGWDKDWREKVRLGYERVSQTLWRVSREFDIRGYGKILREKLTSKWCDCGCSTDHLGEVCEQTVREEEEESGVRVGKQREWDGRGSGVWGWETKEEEDIWEVELDFGGLGPNPSDEGGGDSEMTVGEIMEWRYFKAEQAKEKGNAAFRRGDFGNAVRHYQDAYRIEPEVPHYQLNLAAAHLKLSNWIEVEKACTKALSQHRSSKGYYRRGRARKMLNKPEEAIKDLRAVLKLQPTNAEALAELFSLLPLDSQTTKLADQPFPHPPLSSSVSQSGSGSGSSAKPVTTQWPWARTKADDRRLKIVITPASTSELGLNNDKRSARGTMSDCGNLVAGKGKSIKGKCATGKRLAGNESRNSKRLRQLEEIVKTETIVYPNWERYVVKRVD